MSRNALKIPNPDGVDTAAYTQIVLQRAPDVGSTPGVFATVQTVDIDTTEENTLIVDDSGASDSWYQFYYTDGTTDSDTTDPIQIGDYLVRQWCREDIPDTDITTTKWDYWRDQTIQDIANAGLGRPADIQSIDPSSATDEWHGLNAEIRRVHRVEKYDSGGYLLTATRNWQQRGRQLRIIRPNTDHTYKVYGVAEIRSLADLDDELYTILQWGMRWRYLLFRQGEFQNYRQSLSRTRQANTPSMRDFTVLEQRAKSEYNDRLEKAKMQAAMSYGASS